MDEKQLPVLETPPPLTPDDTSITEHGPLEDPNLIPPPMLDDEADEDVLDSQAGPRALPEHVNLSRAQVRSDPILSRIARQQGHTLESPVATFRARPPPVSMKTQGQGPRMTKSAALRQGLEWDEGKPKRSMDERRPVDFGATPGHKRNNLSLNIASLSRPSLAPRQNRSSQLRAGEAVVTHVKRTPEEVAAELKAKADEEKARRRQSIALPSSLSAPTIAPRMNRTSILRTAGPPVSFPKQGKALMSTTADNVQARKPAPAPAADEKEAKLERRKSMVGTIKSLGVPSIMPRLNKTAMLRTPHTATEATTPGIPVQTSSALATTRKARPQSVAGAPSRPSTVLARTTSNHAAPTAASLARTASIGPRATKSSLLRAGLGAQVTR